MSITETEIFGQYEALARTHAYFLKNAGRIQKFFRRCRPQSLAFIGCGSSYCQCRSAELSAKMRLKLPAVSLAGGDLLVNYPHYRGILQGALLITPSRSGSTSEVVLSVKKLKREFKSPLISICCREKSELSAIAELSLAIPWAFDQGVCQTSSVTNLYTANLCLIAAMAGDKSLFREIGKAIAEGERLMAANKSSLQELGAKDWNHVVVLADSELEGIAGSGALSLKEIAQVHANYYHLLDVRHGPMLLVNEKTLVIMACSPRETGLQKDLVADLKKRGATVVTIGGSRQALGADRHLPVPAYKNFGVMGIHFIFVPQLISYYKAASAGLDPDAPRGLAPWIVLKRR